VAREPDSVYRRRRLVAVAVLAVAALATVIIIVGIGGGDGSQPSPAADPYADVALDRLIGQRLMVRMGGEVTPELLEAARGGTIGGVILFPPAGAEPAGLADQVARLQRAATRGGNPPLLVAIDQEGGDVKRLRAGPPKRSASQLGAAGDAAASSAQGEATASYLAQAGVNVDLAPVLDVAAPGSFVSGRAFSDDPGVVAEIGVAFAEGLQRGGVAATAKHFPGLGLASVNTDFAPSVVAAPRSDVRSGIEPFEAAVAAGVDLVMVANATYTALDADVPAALSERVVSHELRDRIGFDGVVITDDLEAGSITATRTAEDAAVDAARAGADVLLFAKRATPDPIAAALARAARRGALDRASLEAAYGRIVALKDAVAAG
jgi:beta-N-acetylhexosaminidase